MARSLRQVGATAEQGTYTNNQLGELDCEPRRENNKKVKEEQKNSHEESESSYWLYIYCQSREVGQLLIFKSRGGEM